MGSRGRAAKATQARDAQERKVVTKTATLYAVLQSRWLTPLEAATEVGVFALSQRCTEWRRAGVNVLDRWVVLPSGARVKSYHILDKESKA
jgi:hypothetical protein